MILWKIHLCVCVIMINKNKYKPFDFGIFRGSKKNLTKRDMTFHLFFVVLSPSFLLILLRSLVGCLYRLVIVVVELEFTASMMMTCHMTTSSVIAYNSLFLTSFIHSQKHTCITINVVLGGNGSQYYTTKKMETFYDLIRWHLTLLYVCVFLLLLFHDLIDAI